MNEHGITVGNLARTAPRALRSDPGLAALAECAAEALAARTEEITKILIYPAIDELPEDLLDLLAVDFAVDWWSGDWPLERKRQSLKDSWRIHRLLGTPEAVDLAVQAAFGAGEVEEWFEYGGEPNHFRVVGLGPEMAQSGMQAFLRLLGIVKRESSVLDGVAFARSDEAPLYAGLGCSVCRSVDIGGSEPAMVWYLTDENGDILTDENGDRYIDEEV